MSIIEIVLLAIGLSMDSLAVSVTGGAVIRNCTVCNMVKIGSFMGITQATMTVLGYLAGVGFQKYITAFDHWIAFVLLVLIGLSMIPLDRICPVALPGRQDDLRQHPGGR